MPVIIKNLSFRYKNETKRAIDNINLEINDGEFVIIAGSTGSGKSTLLKCLNGLIPRFHGGFYSGTVLVNGLNTLNHEVYELAREIGLVCQNSENQLVTFSVEKEIAFSLENLGFKKEEIRKKVEEIIGLLHLEALRKRTPFELSGGEQQKTNIGAILALNSKILCLDEPTSNLDSKMTKELFDFLQDLNKKHEKTIIIVEHRLDLLISIADRLIIMDDGEVKLDGSPIEVLLSDPIEDIGIEIPKMVSLIKYLKKNNVSFSHIPKNSSEFMHFIEELVK
ncbi:MAG: energy-coupling factor ABC transporter ATP-binding protein [Candidatus Helarchaeota archaeon]